MEEAFCINSAQVLQTGRSVQAVPCRGVCAQRSLHAGSVEAPSPQPISARQEIWETSIGDKQSSLGQKFRGGVTSQLQFSHSM